jgi:hypothetical protein
VGNAVVAMAARRKRESVKGRIMSKPPPKRPAGAGR